MSNKDIENTFLKEHAEYGNTTQIDLLRETEYSRLDREGHIYLDYTGGGLYADGAVRVSLGVASTFADVYRFVQFAQTFLNMQS